MLNLILIAISVIIIAAGLLWRHKLPTVASDAPAPELKQANRNKMLATLTAAVGALFLFSQLLELIFGPASHGLDHISISPERVDILGISVGITVVYSWIAMAILIIGALIIRFTVFKDPKDVPTGVQNVVEVIVDEVGKYTNAQAHGTGEMLCSYILTVAVFLVISAMLELVRLRAPTSDIAVTFSLALLTFALINVYGIKRKGVAGRIKSLASPSPLVFPFRFISEFAIPVSLACRLFGNMLGGFIIVDILYSALGNYAVGIPGVLGLYFHAFHPLIQAYIFVTLTLTFINEAIE